MWIRSGVVISVLALAACGSSASEPSTAAASSAEPKGASEAVVANAIFPYVNVKSWSGHVTAESSGTIDLNGRKTEFTYSASGDVNLVDQSDADVHGLWPNPSPAELNDPARAATAFKRWPAHVTYKSHSTGTGESGEKIDETCTGDETVQALVQIMMMPTGYSYSLFVEPPAAHTTCSGTSQLPGTGTFTQSRVKIDAKVGAPKDPIAGTQEVRMGDIKGTVTYKLTPQVELTR